MKRFMQHVKRKIKRKKATANPGGGGGGNGGRDHHKTVPTGGNKS